jgi:hypothetical protein
MPEENAHWPYHERGGQGVGLAFGTTYFAGAHVIEKDLGQKVKRK